MDNFENKLVKAIKVHEGMLLLVNICKNYKGNDLEPWSFYWDSFWELSKTFPFNVEWVDYDTSYQEDIMQRYLAIDNFMKSNCDAIVEIKQKIALLTKFYNSNIKNKENVVTLEVWLERIIDNTPSHLPIGVLLELLESTLNVTPNTLSIKEIKCQMNHVLKSF